MSNSSYLKNGVGSVFGSVKQSIQIIVQIKGWPYAVAWAHRISGVLLVIYALFHVVTLSSLPSPGIYDAKMRVLQHPVLVLLAWLLAAPVIFHALNGGRLMLYEIFHNRKDALALRWTTGISIAFMTLLGFFMLLGNQRVSELVFWVYTLAGSLGLVYVTIVRLKSSGASMFWKLHRISGAFLFLMIPAHMLFMHLNPTVAHEAQTVISRMDNYFIKLVDLALVISVFYHSGYGLVGICRDYLSLSSQLVKDGSTAVIAAIMALFAWIGLKLIIFI